MSDNRTDDLLSTFYDGEASPDERLEAEKQLETSADAKRQLAEMQKLSEMLQSLPREPLPEEFCAEVMQAAERESLIPSDDRSLRPAANRRTGWRYAIGTLIATAAALFVMVKAFQPTDRQHGVDLAQSTPDASMSADESADSTSAHNEAASVAQLASAGSPASGATDDKEALKDAAADEADAAQPRADGSELPTAVASHALRNAARSLVFDDSRLSEAQVGEVIEALETSGDKIAVVKLTVVDRLEGLEKLQFLLARNQIPRQSVTTEKKADRKQAPARPADRLMAVYVQTNTEQLASTLRHFNKSQFSTLKVEEPIQIASLDDDSKSQIGFFSNLPGSATSDQKPGANAPKLPLVAKDKADQKSAARRKAAPKPSKSDSQKQKKSRNKKRKLVAGQKNQDKAAGSSSPQPAAASRQVSLSLSARILQRPPKATASGKKMKRSRSNALEKSVKVDALKAADKIKGKSLKSTRRLKVLFVLVADGSKGQKSPSPAKPQAKPTKDRKTPEDGAA